ncbi:MAG: ABC transporter substrate-binding protein [Mycobacteriaceae bacterium]
MVVPLVVMALGAAACGSSGSTTAGGTTQSTDTANAVKGGVLNMLGAGDVDYMDPNVSYYSVGYMGLRPWSRQLYTYPADPKTSTTSVPDLADGPVKTSADGKTVTVTLRDGAMWNSTPARAVTAADEVRGIKRTCNPVQPFGGIPDYNDLIEGYASFCAAFAKVAPTVPAIKAYIDGHEISGLKATDDKTIVFTLSHAASYFQDLLTLPAFSPAPVEYLDALPGPKFADNLKTMLSDGPYYVASYSATKAIDYKRNPAWKASSDPIRKAYVDEIKVDETVSQESTQQQLETGSPSADMEFDNFPPATQIPGLVAKKDPNLNLGVTASSNPYLVFNTVSTNSGSAMKNLKFRQALEYGIDRKSLVQVLGGPAQNTPLSHVLPANIVGGEKNFDLYPYDLAKAKAMLQASGMAGATVKILYRNASQGSTKVFATTQQQLTKLGLKVEGVASPNADFYTKYLEVPTVAQRGVWDIAVAGWGADWYGNAALSFFGPLFSGQPSFPPIGSNFGFYSSDATNTLITKATNATTVSEAGKDWAAADQQVMKDAAFFPITQPKQPNYHASQVHNAIYVPAIQNFDPTNVWLSKDKQGG